MKKIILLMVIAMGLQSCSKTDDDTGNVCTTDCTTITGRFVTQGNTPLKGIEVILEYKISNNLSGGRTRIIGKTTTDDNGSYKMVVFLEDREIGNSQGYFQLLIDASNLNPQRFMRNNILYAGAIIYSLPTRDTIIDKSFYIPTKEHITVTLKGFVRVDPEDFFEVRAYFPSGLKIGYNQMIGGEYETGSAGGGRYYATNPDQTFNNVLVALNELNIVRITRTKNGIRTTEDVEVFVTENPNIHLTFEY